MGNIEFETDLTNPDFAKYAEACGGIGYRVEHIDELLPAFENAVKQNKPCIIDVVVDANEATNASKNHIWSSCWLYEAYDKRII